MVDQPVDSREQRGTPSQVERFDSDRHDVTEFQCGEPSLDLYIRDRAPSDRRRRAAVLYVLTHPQNQPTILSGPSKHSVIGYYTLNTLAIPRSRLPKRLHRTVGQYPEVPAALIGRQAIDQRYQGQRLGEALLVEALERITSLANEIAIAVVVVHALHERAAAFYRRFGFQSFSDNALHLFYALGRFEERQGPAQ